MRTSRQSVLWGIVLVILIVVVLVFIQAKQHSDAVIATIVSTNQQGFDQMETVGFATLNAARTLTHSP